MFSSYLILLPALVAASTTTSPTNTTMVTVIRAQITTLTGVAPPAPSVSKRWAGNCEDYCSMLHGNGYYPCMELCPLRLGEDTMSTTPDDTDFIGRGQSPWSWVSTDTASTSDKTDYHHKRGLGAWNGDSDDEGEGEGAAKAGAGGFWDKFWDATKFSIQRILDQIDMLGDAFKDLSLMQNTVAMSSEAEHVPAPIGPEVDEWISEWVVGLRDNVHSEKERKIWTGLLTIYVLGSDTITAQYVARRLEVVARKQTTREVRALAKGLDKEARKTIRAKVRERWEQQFGERVWGPKSALAAVDFE